MQTVKSIWDFFQTELLGMSWLNRLIGDLLNACGLDTAGKVGSRLLRTATHDPRYALRGFYCSLFAIAWSISLSSAARCSAELMAPTIGSPTMLPF